MEYIKGSEWRKWDLHVHTPYSYLNNGFGGDFDEYVKKLFKKAIEKDISVIGITDYFCIEGYKKIKTDYLANEVKLGTLFTPDEIDKIRKIRLFPNIEFRLNKLINEENRVNFHVIFSDEVSVTDIEENFLHELSFVYEGNPSATDELRKLKLSNIEELGLKLRSEHAKFSSFTDLYTGMMCAVVDDEQISQILINKISKFDGKYLIFTPSDEDLSSISWNGQNHNIRKILIQKSNGLFSSNSRTIQWGLGKTYTDIDEYIREFKTLKPCIWGSDAHDFLKLFEPDLNKHTWIKADLTFEGLKQIIYEPEDRVFIGEKPEVLERVKNNKTKYIKSLKIDQISGYDEKKGVWFKNQQIEFNKELVAIIGNKGNGKSAIADILGLLGNTRNFNNFSFLDSKRFHKDKLSKSFQGFLEWENGVVDNRILWDGVLGASNPEKVRYLPQSFFDTLTTELSGKDFKETLEKVIFQHLDDSLKMGKDSFDALNKYKTQSINAEIDKIKVLLVDLNREILELEMKSLPDFLAKVENSIKEKDVELSEKRKLLEDLNKKEVKNPNDDELSKQIKSKHFEEIEKLNALLLGINIKIEEQKLLKGKLEIDKEEITTLLANFKSIEDQVAKYKLANKEKLLKYGINIDDVIKLQIDKDLLVSKLSEVNQGIQDIVQLFLVEEDLSDIDEDQRLLLRAKSLLIQKQKYLENIEKQKQALSKPEKEYQEYLEQKNLIDLAIIEIVGSIDKPNTLEYHKGIKSYINLTLQGELSILKERRLELSLLILAEKKKIIDLFKAFKEPIDKKVEDNREYLDEEYAINIDVKLCLDNNFIHNFLYYVNQGKKGSFSGKIEGELILKAICGEKDFYEESSIKEMLFSLLDHLSYDKREDWDNEERVPSEQISDLGSFYNYLFGLDYLDPEYELKSGKKSLEALSPGEKGTLLLIFYLLIDKEGIPLIIDQPEDNLDNQSVFKMLTRFIKMAKKQRQIIIVTHNPNLAVGADAEQIIYVKIDKEEGNNTFSFESGSIENNKINEITVNILEGTMPAFDKRRLKYKRK